MEYNRKPMINSKKAFKPIEISEDGLELIEFLSLDCTAADGKWYSDSEIKIDKLGYVIRTARKPNPSVAVPSRVRRRPCD